MQSNRSKETHSKDFFRSTVDEYHNPLWHDDTFDLLFRDITGHDLGVDGLVEVFDHDVPTGKIAYVQLKATEKITPLIRTPEKIGCPNVTASCLAYCKQDRIPMILVFVQVSRPRVFYYVDMRTEGVQLLKKKKQDSYTFHIPVANNSEENLQGLVDIIERYYE